MLKHLLMLVLFAGTIKGNFVSNTPLQCPKGQESSLSITRDAIGNWSEPKEECIPVAAKLIVYHDCRSISASGSSNGERAINYECKEGEVQILSTEKRAAK